MNYKKSMKSWSILLILIFGCLSTGLAAGDGYQIKFRINGKKDTTCLIAYYYSNGTYVKDTVKLDHLGRCTYTAPEDTPKGLYIFAVSDKSYFDFVINNDKKFSMETKADDLSGSMVILDSPDNTLFYEYLKNNRLQYDEIQKIQEEYKKAGEPADSAAHYAARINEINRSLIRYKLDLVEKHPKSFIAMMINAMKEPEITEIPTLPDGKKDSAAAYRMYKEQYWDGTDFTDDRLLRTPVFHSKLKKYFESIVVQNTDSIISEVDKLVELCRPNPEMFKYLVWFSTYTFENSEIMGFDKIFVHVVDKYYITGQATWINSDIKDKIIKKANKIKPTLIGSVAPEMIMLDTNNRLISMHQLPARYLILLFWDPDCSHCEHEIPIIGEFYEKNKEKYGLEVFAVCSDTSMVKWKKGIIKKNMKWINVNGPRRVSGDYHELYDIISTPLIFILNDRKEIVAKKLAANKIEYFLENYDKNPRKP